jgi:uncharacterized delta-60 repeat protein
MRGLPIGFVLALLILLSSSASDLRLVFPPHNTWPGPEVNESAERYEIKIIRDLASAEVTVTYRVLLDGKLATNDIINATGTFTFKAGEREKVVPLQLVRDGLVEPGQLMVIEATSDRGANASGTFSLHDEQKAAGWDHSFPFIRNVGGVAKLQDESLIILQPFAGLNKVKVSRVDATGKAAPNFAWIGSLKSFGNLEGFALADGGALLGGNLRFNFWDYAVVRFKPTGEAEEPPEEMKSTLFVGFQSSGKTLVRSGYTIIRCGIDGRVDPAFRGIPVAPFDFRFKAAIALRNDNIAAYVSSSNFIKYVKRFSVDGKPLDEAPLAQIAWEGSSLAMEDGGFAIAGQFAEEGTVKEQIIRWRADGTVMWKAPPLGELALQRSNQVHLFSPRHGMLARIDDNLEVRTEFIQPPELRQIVNATFGETVYALRDGGSYDVKDLGRIFLRNREISDVTFEKGTFHLTEKGGGDVKILRVGDTSKAASLVAVTAAENLTYNAQIHFAPLETEKVMRVGVQDDNLPEKDSISWISLENVVGATKGEFPTAEVRVVDDDGRPGNIAVTANRWELLWREPDIRDMLQLRDGRIFVAGRASINGEPYFYSFSAEGDLDPTVHPLEPGVNVVREQSDGKLVFAGERTCVQRWNPDGTYAGLQYAPFYNCHATYALAIQADDKILLAGILSEHTTGNSIVRLESNGLPDRSFRPPYCYQVQNIVVQPDGKILLLFLSSGVGLGATGARLLPDGTVDPGFEPIRLAQTWFYHQALALQSDGKILVSQTERDPPRTHLVRLNENGSRDGTFALREEPDGAIVDVVVQRDGRIVVGGLFTKIGGIARAGVARLLPSGEVDLGFDPGTGGVVSRMILLRDGNILVAGNFKTFNGMRAPGLAYIRTSVPLRFLNPTERADLFSATLTGDSGTEYLIEATRDFKTWELVRNEQIKDYTAPISVSRGDEAIFLRARSR